MFSFSPGSLVQNIARKGLLLAVKFSEQYLKFMNGSCELFILLKAPFCGDTKKQWLLIMGLLGIHGLLLPALLCPKNQLWLLCLSCNLYLEAAFGGDATAVPSYSDVPPPDNESNIPLTGSCKGEKSILQLLIKSKHPYFQQQKAGLLYWEIYYPFFYKAERDLFCRLCSFFHMLSSSGMGFFESSDDDYYYFSIIIYFYYSFMRGKCLSLCGRLYLVWS